MRNKALLLVDIQNDFCPGGALEVASGDEVVSVANRIAKHFDLVIATQDWHPPDHGSFASNHAGGKPGEVIELDGLDQVLWPDHCVQESSGAELREDLDLGPVKKVFKKGTDPTIDSYSAFYDNGHRKSTGLSDYLKQCDVQDVYIMGLATDYCVKETVLDGLRLDFDVTVLADGIRAVGLEPGDGARAIAEMVGAGARVR